MCLHDMGRVLGHLRMFFYGAQQVMYRALTRWFFLCTAVPFISESPIFDEGQRDRAGCRFSVTRKNYTPVDQVLLGYRLVENTVSPSSVVAALITAGAVQLTGAFKPSDGSVEHQSLVPVSSTEEQQPQGQQIQSHEHSVRNCVCVQWR